MNKILKSLTILFSITAIGYLVSAHDSGIIRREIGKVSGITAGTGVDISPVGGTGNVTVSVEDPLVIDSATVNNLYTSTCMVTGYLASPISQLGTPTAYWYSSTIDLGVFGVYPLFTAKSPGTPLGDAGAIAPFLVISPTCTTGIPDYPALMFFMPLVGTAQIKYQKYGTLDVIQTSETIRVLSGDSIEAIGGEGGGADGGVKAYWGMSDLTKYIYMYHDGTNPTIQGFGGSTRLMDDTGADFYLSEVEAALTSLTTGFVNAGSTFTTANVGTLIFGDNTTMTTAGGGSSPWLTKGASTYFNNYNVGIGTDSPKAMLELNTDDTRDPVIRINQLVQSTNEATHPRLLMCYNNNTAAGGQIAYDPYYGKLIIRHNGSNPSNDIYFQAGAGAPTVMTVQGDGYVGIGTTGPTKALDVVGVVKTATGTATGVTPFSLGGSADALPTTGFDKGTMIYLISDNCVYVSTETVSKVESWVKIGAQ